MLLLVLETAAMCRPKHSLRKDPKPRWGTTSSSAKDRLESGHRAWARWDLVTRQRRRSAVGWENLLERKGFRAKIAKNDEGSDLAWGMHVELGVFEGHCPGMIGWVSTSLRENIRRELFDIRWQFGAETAQQAGTNHQ